jgi:hypothetical protein
METATLAVRQLTDTHRDFSRLSNREVVKVRMGHHIDLDYGDSRSPE